MINWPVPGMATFGVTDRSELMVPSSLSLEKRARAVVALRPRVRLLSRLPIGADRVASRPPPQVVEPVQVRSIVP